MRISDIIKELEYLLSVQGDIDVVTLRNDYVGQRVCTPIVSVGFVGDKYLTDSEEESENKNNGCKRLVVTLN